MMCCTTRKHIHPDVEPLLIVLTDGAGNVSIGTLAPAGRMLQIRGTDREREDPLVVINMEHAAFDQGLAQQLANHLKAPCLFAQRIEGGKFV